VILISTNLVSTVQQVKLILTNIQHDAISNILLFANRVFAVFHLGLSLLMQIGSKMKALNFSDFYLT